MRKAIARTASGWAILGVEGMPVREVEELCFMADLKHDLALFPGTRNEVDEVMARLGRKCKTEKHHLKMVQLGVDVDEAEANYMLTSHRLPRRVAMRLR